MHRTTVLLPIFAALLGTATCTLAQNSAAAKSSATSAQPSTTAPSGKPTQQPEWIARSNELTQRLLDVQLKYSPESASTLGIVRFDDAITDASHAGEIRQRKELQEVLSTLKKDAAKEQDSNVRRDLEILQNAYSLEFRREDYSFNHKVEFVDAAQAIAGGLRTLLTDDVKVDRRAAAVIRLRKYAGVEPGFTPFTEVVRQRLIEQMAKPDMTYPSTIEIEAQFAHDKETIDNIGTLLAKYKLTGWQESFAKLQEQLGDYETWIRSTILPKAVASTHPTPEEFAFNLEVNGIEVAPTQLTSDARAAFTETQAEMAPLAAEVAKQHGWSATDYRQVLRELKKQQLDGNTILPLYQTRLKKIEDVIAAKNLATLPTAPALLRVSTAEEQVTAPHLVPLSSPRETGQKSEFVLPLIVSKDAGSKDTSKDTSTNADAKTTDGKDAAASYDDFTFDAVAWPTIARELRPGNELNFNSITQYGISLARRKYAFNATDLNGWGLYAEWLIQPYEPADGQLATLQLRLLRAASVFLASDLLAAKITPDDAVKLLENDVVLSPAFAAVEVDRFNSRAAGQSDSYFYAYTTLLQLRKDTESALGKRFNAKSFNDFVLAQGVLPPSLLRKAVLEDFVAPQKKKK